MILFSMLTVSQAADSLGICTSTLRRWEKCGKIASKRTIGGHRRYPTNIYNQFYGIADSDYESTAPIQEQRRPYIYARVSSNRQYTDGNLDRQAQDLEKKVRKRLGPKANPVIIKEYGSGLNPMRAGLRKLIDAVQKGLVSKCYISFKDRITRYGFFFLERLFKIYDVAIEEMEVAETVDPQQQLVTDIMSLMACFSGRLYSTRRKRRKNGDEIQPPSEDMIEQGLANEWAIKFHHWAQKNAIKGVLG
jgi:excisionase family DNA binding protein